MEIQNKLSTVQALLKAPKGQTNTFGNYKYRSCEDILEAVKPILKELDCSLLISDEIVQLGDRYYVKATAILKCEGGEVSTTAYAREPKDKKGMDEAQITGATSSYARKYALNGLFCIDDTKDADATNDHGKLQQTQREPQKTSEPPKRTPRQAVNDLVAMAEKNGHGEPEVEAHYRFIVGKNNALLINLLDKNVYDQLWDYFSKPAKVVNK